MQRGRAPLRRRSRWRGPSYHAPVTVGAPERRRRRPSAACPRGRCSRRRSARRRGLPAMRTSSGVAYRSVAAMSAPQTTTASSARRSSGWPASPTRSPSTPAAIAYRAEPAVAADHEPMPIVEREEADHDRGERVLRTANRRQRDECREARPSDDSAQATARRRVAGDAHASALLRAFRSASRRTGQSTMMSAPTKSTTSPWMMIARLEARSGGK